MPYNKDGTIFLGIACFVHFLGKIMFKTLSSAAPSLYAFLLRIFLWLLVYPLLLSEVSVQENRKLAIISVVYLWLRNELSGKHFSHTHLEVWLLVCGGSRSHAWIV